MPLTGRSDSYAPARFAERILPGGPSAGRARDALNYVVHFGLGIGWGVAYGVAAHRGLRGQRAVAAVVAAARASTAPRSSRIRSA